MITTQIWPIQHGRDAHSELTYIAVFSLIFKGFQFWKLLISRVTPEDFSIKKTRLIAEVHSLLQFLYS